MDIHEIDYNVKLKNYLNEQFCPTDGYLEAVKGKFSCFGNDRDSQFQNIMRRSHIAKPKCYSTDNRNPSCSNVSKDNPFLRKNLISAPT